MLFQQVEEIVSPNKVESLMLDKAGFKEFNYLEFILHQEKH